MIQGIKSGRFSRPDYATKANELELLHLLVDICDCFPNGGYLLCIFIGDFPPEFLLKGHD